MALMYATYDDVCGWAFSHQCFARRRDCVVVRLLHAAEGIDMSCSLAELGLVPRGTVVASIQSDEERAQALQQVRTQHTDIEDYILWCVCNVLFGMCAEACGGAAGSCGHTWEREEGQVSQISLCWLSPTCILAMCVTCREEKVSKAQARQLAKEQVIQSFKVGWNYFSNLPVITALAPPCRTIEEKPVKGRRILVLPSINLNTYYYNAMCLIILLHGKCHRIVDKSLVANKEHYCFLKLIYYI